MGDLMKGGAIKELHLCETYEEQINDRMYPI